MGIYLSTKRVKKGVDYLFIDDLSKECYQNALFRIHFKYDALKKEHQEIIEEYLTTISQNLIEMLNGYDDESIHSGSHEDRIKALEDEIATLTNDISTQIPRHGTLNITPITESMDFNKEGTMLKFTNVDNGVYTTGILKNNEVTEIVLPVGQYTVNIVNSLNDIVDSTFTELWYGATSQDDNHTMVYTVVEGNTTLNAFIEYELQNQAPQTQSIGD